MEDAKNLQVGDSVYLQTYLAGIYERVVSVSMVDIRAYAATSEKYIPMEEEYSPNNVVVSHRQKAVFDISRIEVILHDDQY